MLDTNALSELMHPAPEPAVLALFAVQPPHRLLVIAVTQAEVMLAARPAPAGNRGETLEDVVRAMFEEDFAGLILPFDSMVVPNYVDVVSRRREAGRPVSQFDAQDAAIARHHGAGLATRDA